jgi:hypothetical protein
VWEDFIARHELFRPRLSQAVRAQAETSMQAAQEAKDEAGTVDVGFSSFDGTVDDA